MSRQHTTTRPARGAVATVPDGLAAIGQALGVPIDLDAIGGAANLFGPRGVPRAQVLDWLERRRHGDGYGDAMTATGCPAWAIVLARQRSRWFAAVEEHITNERRAQDVADVERVMVQAARGQVARDKTRYAPDVRAAQLFLAASSERYRPGVGSAVPPVAIQINL